MDIFLNQLTQLYSNNATNLHQLTTHSTTALPHKMAIVLRTHICDVISPYVYMSQCLMAPVAFITSTPSLSVVYISTSPMFGQLWGHCPQ